MEKVVDSQIVVPDELQTRAVVPATFDFLVNNEPLSLDMDFEDGTLVNVVTLTTEQLNTFEWLDADENVSITVNGIALVDGKCEFDLDTISAENKIQIQITEDEVERYFQINTLNTNLPPITAEGQSKTSGDFFLSFINTRSIVKADNDGNILYYRNEDAVDQQFGLWDFKTHFIDGKTYYSYHSTYSDPGDSIVFTGHNPGERVIMDENYQVVKRIHAIPTEMNNGDTTLDGHEFLLLGENHYIVMSYLQVTVDNIPDQNQYTLEPLEHADSAVLVAAYIQEVEDGEVKFEWLSTDHPELYSMTVADENPDAADFNNTDPGTYVDYVHLNAIALDDDENLVISCRHLNSMIKINRNDGTGDLIWALSGLGDDFSLTEDQNTNGQHYLRYLGNGYFSAFNNNNKENLTNLVLYHLDEKNMTLNPADGFLKWVVPGTTEIDGPDGKIVQPHDTYACGSFQLFGNYGVAGWGWSLSGDELVTEFQFDDPSQISFQLRAIYDPLASCATYRVVKCLSEVPEMEITSQSANWTEIAETTRYMFSIGQHGSDKAMRVIFSGATSCDLFNLPNGSYDSTITEYDLHVSSDISTLTVEDNGSPSVVVSETNGVGDLFFVKPNGVWNGKYHAKNTGSVNDWAGTKERVSLQGKNQFNDILQGSDDYNLLLLTDDPNGDALFLDDIFSTSPDDLGATQARIAKIMQISAGAGDDVVDLTSSRFEYSGSGVAVTGGAGNDVIWANKGKNILFGDAGNDRIVGASGNDTIVGGAGNDSMHGGGGDDTFTFGGNWGQDTIEQLATGTVTLWFDQGDASKWNADTLTYTDGENSVTVTGVEDVTLVFGAENEQFDKLYSVGAFSDFASENLYTKISKALIAWQ